MNEELNDDDTRLDEIIAAVRAEPFADGPPDKVRQHVAGLADDPIEIVPASLLGGFMKHVIQAAAIAAALIIPINTCWWYMVHDVTPVGWIRETNDDVWYVMYQDGRTATAEAPIGKGSN